MTTIITHGTSKLRVTCQQLSRHLNTQSYADTVTTYVHTQITHVQPLNTIPPDVPTVTRYFVITPDSTSPADKFSFLIRAPAQMPRPIIGDYRDGSGPGLRPPPPPVYTRRLNRHSPTDPSGEKTRVSASASCEPDGLKATKTCAQRIPRLAD